MENLKLKKFVLFILINLIFIPSYSFAEVVLDNSTGNTSTSSLSAFGTQSTTTYGQLFTPSSDMNIDSVTFSIKKNSGSDADTQAVLAYIYEYNAATNKITGLPLGASNEINIMRKF